MRAHVTTVLLLVVPLAAFAGGDDRDYSGNWTLDQQKSDMRGLPANPGPVLSVNLQGSAFHCSESGATWSFRADGTASDYQIGGASMSTEAKWEGAALLINTLVSGRQSYVIEDRWEMSRDQTTLTITRVIRRASSRAESTLVYRNRERLAALRAPAPAAKPANLALRPAEAHVEPPAAAPDFVVKAGTRIPLSLVNSLSTKHTEAGDRVYLETAFPVVQDGRIIIPKGSYVTGTVTEVKRAGRVKGRAELFLRFDTMTLPNGVTRDFRSRLDSAGANDVDRGEGKIRGDSNKAGDAKTVGEATGAGASVGAIAGSVAGHGAMGVGIGAAAGAAAGLAAVLLSRGPDVVLPRGTTVEMVLDRDLRYRAKELAAR